MNNPVVLAAIGVVVTLVLYNVAGTIRHRILRAAAQLGSVAVPLALLGLASATVQTASDAGKYYASGIIAAYILSRLFGRSEKT